MPPEDAARLVADFAIGSLLDLLGVALLDRQFNRLAWQRFEHELRWFGKVPGSQVPQLLGPHVAQQFVALPNLKLASTGITVASAPEREGTDLYAPFSEDESLLLCQECRAPLLKTDDILSSNYRIMTGRAYFSSSAYNVTMSGSRYEAQYTTGQYTVCNIACVQCSLRLGIVYIDCEDRENEYKVGKFLLGQHLLVRPTCCSLHERPHPVRVPTELCARCSCIAVRGVLHLIRILTRNLCVSDTRCMYNLLLQQKAVDIVTSGRVMGGRRALVAPRKFASWCCPILHNTQASGTDVLSRVGSSKRRTAPSSELFPRISPDLWQETVKRRLGMFGSLREVFAQSTRMKVDLTTAIRFVNALCSAAWHAAPPGSVPPDRVSSLLRLLPMFLPDSQPEALYAARALVLAVRNEWVVRAVTTFPTGPSAHGELTAYEVEAIVAGIASCAAVGLDRCEQQAEVDDDDAILHCLACGTHIVRISDIISSNYRVVTGPAYLASVAENVAILEEVQEASYMSGYYRVRDVDCAQCRVRLGVTYVGAVDPENHYKIGKFLLGQDQLLAPTGRSIPTDEAALRDELLVLLQGGNAVNVSFDSPLVRSWSQGQEELCEAAGETALRAEEVGQGPLPTGAPVSHSARAQLRLPRRSV